MKVFAKLILVPLLAILSTTTCFSNSVHAAYGLSIVSRADCPVALPWPVIFIPPLVFNESITWSTTFRRFYLWTYSYHWDDVNISPEYPPNHFMAHDGSYVNSSPNWPSGVTWEFTLRSYAGDVFGLPAGLIGNGDKPHQLGVIDKVAGDHYMLEVRSGTEVYLGSTEATDCNIFDW